MDIFIASGKGGEEVTASDGIIESDAVSHTGNSSVQAFRATSKAYGNGAEPVAEDMDIFVSVGQTGEPYSTLPPLDGPKDPVDLYFRDYVVEIRADNSTVRTDTTRENNYTYTYEMNAEDYKRKNGVEGAHRSFQIRVTQRGRNGQVSDNPAVLDVFNPPPALPKNLSIVPGFSVIEISYDKPDDLDFAGVQIWVSPTSGFDPNSVPPTAVVQDNSHTIAGLQDGALYYVVFRPFDVFGVEGAVFSAERAITTKTAQDLTGLSGWAYEIDPLSRQFIEDNLEDGVIDLSSVLISGELQNVNLADASVNAQKLSDLSVESAKLADSAVTSTKIANLAVGNAAIANLAVTNAKIGDLSVDNSKIANLAVDNAKIADLAVTDAKIIDLTAAKLTAGTINAVGGITTESIFRAVDDINAPQYQVGLGPTSIDGSVYLLWAYDEAATVGNKLRFGFDELGNAYFNGSGSFSGSVTITEGTGVTNLSDAGSLATKDQADSGDVTFNYAGSDSKGGSANDTLSVNGVPVSQITSDISQALEDAQTAQDTADNKIRTFYQDTAPTGLAVADSGDLWIDTDDSNKLYRWSGSGWVAARDGGIGVALQAAQDAETAAGTKVTTFFQSTEPTANIEGDQWYNTSTDELKVWNGASWAKIGSGTEGADWESTLSNIPDRFTDVAVVGLNLTATHLGYYDGTTWNTYIDSSGSFHFGGDNGNFIDYNGANLVINTPQFNVDASGNATFSGDLSAASGTFSGSLSAATGTFSGYLSAAGGTFSGNLDAVGGTFSGYLSAAGGTFSGDLSAAGGTFSGDLSAAGGTFSGSLDASQITTGTLDVNRLATIGSAQIANGSITNAKIDYAAVDTLQIKGQAVTFPRAKTTSTMLRSNGINFSNVFSFNFTATGAPLLIDFSVTGTAQYDDSNNSQGAAGKVRLYFNSNNYRDFTASMGMENTNTTLSGSLYVPNPGGGGKSARIYIYNGASDTDWFKVVFSAITILEAKR